MFSKLDVIVTLYQEIYEFSPNLTYFELREDEGKESSVIPHIDFIWEMIPLKLFLDHSSFLK